METKVVAFWVRSKCLTALIHEDAHRSLHDVVVVSEGLVRCRARSITNDRGRFNAAGPFAKV